MIKSILLTLAASASLVTSQAHGCSAPARPFESEFASYSQVYVGQVVSVHLTEYERRLRESLGSDSPGDVGLYFGSSSLEHEVKAVVTQRLKGSPPETVTVTLGGCGVFIPQVGEQGIFFVSERGLVVPVYANQKFWFTQWVMKATEYYRSKS